MFVILNSRSESDENFLFAVRIENMFSDEKEESLTFLANNDSLIDCKGGLVKNVKP